MAEDRVPRLLVFLFRGVVAVNFLYVALSFLPWFKETPGGGAMYERLFGAYRLGGFRVDFVWLVASTLFIFCAAGFFVIAFIFMPDYRKDRNARLDGCLSIGWVVAFLLYLAWMLFSGMIDFG